jgi:CMP-N,N'-diacetyllegionaminic acid synthase
VPSKNIRPLAGRPLIAHTIDRAVSSGFFDVIAVSSDSREILNVAASCGVKILIERPAELASDAAPKIPAIQHAVLKAEEMLGRRFEVICDLDPTSPFRSAKDIHKAVQILEENADVRNVITGSRSRKSPYFNMVELDHNFVPSLVKKPLGGAVARRQDAPTCYDMNASIYVWKRNALFLDNPLFNSGTRLYEMAAEHSLDIDTELDFEIAEALAKKGRL